MVGAMGLAVLAVVVFSMTSRGVRTTRIHASSSLDGNIMSERVILLRLPVTHHAHPALAAALLAAALVVAGLTVWQVRRSSPTEAS